MSVCIHVVVRCLFALSLGRMCVHFNRDYDVCRTGGIMDHFF